MGEGRTIAGRKRSCAVRAARRRDTAPPSGESADCGQPPSAMATSRCSAMRTVCERTAARSPSSCRRSAHRLPACRRQRQPDRADRLARHRAAGAGDAGDGHRQIGRRAGQRAGRHRAGHRLADRAVRLDQRRRHAERLGLGRIAVGDPAAVEPVARPGQLGAGGGDQPAGARLGARQPPAAPRAAPRPAGRRRRRGVGRPAAPSAFMPPSTARSRAACTAPPPGRRTGCRSPARQPMTSCRSAPRRGFHRPSAQATGPGLAASKIAEQRERRGLRPEARRHDQRQHQPERQHLVPDDGAGVGHAEMPRGQRAGPPADHGERRPARRPRPTADSCGRTTRKASQAHSVPTVPGATRRQPAAEAERDEVRRMRKQEAQRRPAPRGAQHTGGHHGIQRRGIDRHASVTARGQLSRGCGNGRTRRKCARPPRRRRRPAAGRRRRRCGRCASPRWPPPRRRRAPRRRRPAAR